MGIEEGAPKRRISSSKKPKVLSPEESKKAKNLKNRRKKLAKRSKKMQEKISLKRNSERNGEAADDEEEEEMKQYDSEEEEKEKRARRQYEIDLELYLDQWLLHMDGEPNVWKFNKVLQSWAATHCLDKAEVSSDIFKKLVPYLCTVQGAAKQRLKESLMEIAADEPILSGSTDEEILLAEAAKKSAWKRACKLLVNLQESEEQEEE